jgi:GNAT superfamily N-acetyltransferase
LKTAGEYSIYQGLEKRGELAQACFLVAQQRSEIAGTLIFIQQPIGPEMDVPVICDSGGTPLLEAKIRSFYIRESFRNRGIGTQLQREALHLAAETGCYQVRSRSELDKAANYAVKLKLGFAMHPAERIFQDGRRSPGVYWVKRV